MSKETGEPIEGARIGMSLHPHAWWQEYAVFLTTDSDGVFESEVVPEGTYRVRIRHDDFAELRAGDIEFIRNERKEDLEFRMEPPNVLEGLLKRKGPKGDKAQKYWIRLEVSKWADGGIWGDLSEEGRFVFKNLPAGPVKVIVRGPERFELIKRVVLPLPEGERLEIEVP